SCAHPVCHRAPSTYSTNDAPNISPSSLLDLLHSTVLHQYAGHKREPTQPLPDPRQSANPYLSQPHQSGALRGQEYDDQSCSAPFRILQASTASVVFLVTC